MSVGATPVSEAPISAQVATSVATRTPTKRVAIAKADAVTQPEPR